MSRKTIDVKFIGTYESKVDSRGRIIMHKDLADTLTGYCSGACYLHVLKDEIRVYPRVYSVLKGDYENFYAATMLSQNRLQLPRPIMQGTAIVRGMGNYISIRPVKQSP